jgi:hypothetical protein
VLGQLGNRIQHALRAFTPEDADALRKTVRTYPTSDLYDLETLLTSLGIGEAAVTVLDERGVPTPVVHTRLRAPRSSMEPAEGVEAAAGASPLAAKYGQRLDRESAFEQLAKRVEEAPGDAKAPKPAPKTAPAAKPKPKAEDDGNVVTDFLSSSTGKTLQRELVRGAFGLLKKRVR